MSSVSKALTIVGIVMVVAGVLFLLGEKLPFVGKLPGDIKFEGERWTFYFPIATCTILSLILTVLLNLIGRAFFKP